MSQILHISSIPDFAAVSETVKLGRHKGERAFVNGVLRRTALLHKEGALPLPKREKNVARYLSVVYSFPLYVVKRFISLFGEEECEELLKCFLESSYCDLTVNTNLIGRDELLSRFKEAGIDAEPSARSPLTVRINRSFDPRILPGFEEGHFFVQDEACAISILALSPCAGERIADVCAAPGGKSFTAGILMNNTGSIYSYDLHESKLSLIRDGAARLGLNTVTVSARDAEMPDTDLFGTLDKVICDVPCSGLGVLGKKADLKYRPEESISELPELQYSILSASAKYLKAGGEMIYSTCTLNPSENEDVVRRFLDCHPEFSAVDFTVGNLASRDGLLTLVPHRDLTDGFFIAKLKKES